MRSRNVWLWAWLSATLAVACDNPPEQQGPVGLGGDMDASVTPVSDGSTPVSDGSAPSVDGSTALPDGAVSLLDAGKAPRVGPAFAVVSSDWSSTAISITDVEGKVLPNADSYLNSGSAKAGLVTALSGDVELPKHSGERGILVLLDRFRTDVLTRIRLSDGAVLGQVKTHTPPTQATTTSYSSTPHDYIYVDAQTAWITRGEPNLDAEALAIDRGDDLFRIDPSTMQRTGDRIDLSAIGSKATRTDPATGTTQEVQLYVRPSRMVRLGRTVVVGISRTAFDFKAMGDGVVALVDLNSKVVTGFPLDGLKNCNGVDAIPGDTDSVVVTCGGDFNAVAKDTAGIVLLTLTSTGAMVEQVWRAKDDSALQPLTSGTVSFGGTLVGVTANDYSGKGPDVYAMLDLASKKKTEIVTVNPGKGRFGTAAYDIDTGLLLLPDASVDADNKPSAGLRRFQRNADGSFTELAITKLAVSSGMPVRHVYPL